jgi:plastocyanin
MRTRAARFCAAVGALAAGAVLAGGAQAAKETTVEVTMAGRAYQPTELTVGLGQTVVWKNLSLTHHTVTSTLHNGAVRIELDRAA